MAAVPVADYKSALLREAASRSVKPVTLKRRLLAARYVEHHLNGGAKCIASVASIEALMLLERRAPEQAAEMRPGVFAGRLTAREMARLAELAQPGVTTREYEKDWLSFTKSICEICFDSIKSFTARDISLSDKRSFFLVDVEVDTSSEGQAAIYFSPELPFSALRSQPHSRQVALAFAALASYDQVVMVLTTEAERKTYIYAERMLRPRRARKASRGRPYARQSSGCRSSMTCSS